MASFRGCPGLDAERQLPRRRCSHRQNGHGVSATACQTCHGTAGEGIAQADLPRLAGLSAPYLQRQLAAIADGTRVSDVMMPIAPRPYRTDNALK